jgi:hypothetical protein
MICLYVKYGRKWCTIAGQLKPRRTWKQSKDRMFCLMNPIANIDPWSVEEDTIIVKVDTDISFKSY